MRFVGNPALSKSTFQGFSWAGLPSTNPATGEPDSRPFGAAGPMTLSGTMNKTLIMLLLLVAAAIFAWNVARTQENNVLVLILSVVGFIGGMQVALVTIFNKESSHVTAPIFAVLKGFFLGGVSSVFAHPGIFIQAAGLTYGVLFSLLLVYRPGPRKVTDGMLTGIAAALGGIIVVYLATMVMGSFGWPYPFIHEGGMLGIGLSLTVAAIAAFCLVLDFNSVKEGAAAGAPKYMEWYGSFGLMFTLVWLCIGIFYILAGIAGSDSDYLRAPQRTRQR